MYSDSTLTINPSKAVQTSPRLTVNLQDAFFKALDQDEVLGGDVEVNLAISSQGASFYEVKLQIKGDVTVVCDRCLDPLNVSVACEDVVKVKDDDADETQGTDLLYTEVDGSIDLGWTVYEVIITALPPRRIHLEGQCNPDTAKYIAGEA